MGIRQAARDFSIPKSTLHHHACINDLSTVGRSTIFSINQEKAMADRILYLVQRGYPLSIDDDKKYAYQYALTLRDRKELIRPLPLNWCQNLKCSGDWWDSFRKRHTSLTVRLAQHISISRAQGFCEERVSKFYKVLNQTVRDLEIENYPQLIFNLDETGLRTVPNTCQKVVCKKVVRNVLKMQAAKRGVLTTLVPIISAVGEVLPPFLIFKDQTVPSNFDYLIE